MKSVSLGSIALFVLAAASSAAVGCGASAPAPNAPIAHAMSMKVTWEKVAVGEGKDLSGRAVDEVEIKGGEIVRIESDAPILVGERVRSGKGFAETWTTMAPQHGVVTVRATLLATAVMTPKGTMGRVHVAHGFDPGYAWYELEEAVIVWAEGPLPGSFPIVAPMSRIDYDAFAEMDRVLADAVSKAKDPQRALEAAKSIRRVAALRAVRALRPMEGFPYFYDHRVEPTNDPKKVETEDGHVLYHLSPASPVEVTVEGPTMLDIWSRAVKREDDEAITLEVFEGERLRAKSSGTITKSAKARADESTPLEELDTMPLHRALVHVPPGKHSYKITAEGGTAFIFPLVADPVIHLGDALARAKNEEKHLGIAAATCDANDAPAICALALAMLGKDSGAVWEQAIGRSSPEGKALAQVLSQGGPHDPSVMLEDAAANGDPTALAALGEAAETEVDDGLRAAWVRGTTHGTRWLVADEGGPESWTSLLFDRDGEDTKCAGATDAPWIEVTSTETSFATTTWRGAPTLELLATASCSAGGPIGLEIDGEKMTVNPSSARAKWHVLVASKNARVKRTDGGEGHVFAVVPEGAACGGHWGQIHAPRVASTSPQLAFGPKVTAPGVEVWLKDGAKSGEVTVTGTHGEASKIVVVGETGFSALDKDGVRWTRVARLALPAWAAKGATITGKDDVAVRAIVRAPRAVDPSTITPPPPKENLDAKEARVAEPLDEALLTKLSKDVLSASSKEARGAAYLKRGLALATGGAAHAAMEDARAAKALGAKGPQGEDAIEYVKTAIRPMPKKPLVLPAGVKAYGVEPDFDPSAPRCGIGSKGPRAMLASVADELKASSAASSKTFDPALAVKAFEAIEANPIDPRDDAILAKALSGSRWMTPKTLDGNPLKVQRPADLGKEGPLDPDGDLRARVDAGHPYDGSFATITEGHPAKAILTGTKGAKGRVEYVCVARSPADALEGACPIEVTVGSEKPLHGKTGADGHGTIELPPLAPKGKQDLVTISLGDAPGRWQAVARIVFDQEVPNGVKTADGWVLKVPGLQYRFLLKNGEQAGAKVDGPTLVRVDAIAEEEEKPRVVVVIDGKENAIAIDGSPHIFAVPKGGEVTVKSLGGASTILLAERIAKASGVAGVEDAEIDPVHSEVAIADSPGEASAEETTAVLDPNGATATWKDIVGGSPRPMTTFEEDFGTVTTRAMALTGTLRDGDLAKDRDSFFEQAIGYRRKIESIGLWTGFGGALREREQNPSYALTALAYEEFGRLRLAGWVDYWGQDIGGQKVHTWQPRAFVEYSMRVASNVFILPRVGYDGFHSSLHYQPNSLDEVDDNVFNSFRARHPNEAFGQVLAWWVPYINDIFYFRARSTFDADLKAFDHVALRPGAFFALGDFELGVYEDTTWYRATAGIRSDSAIDVTGSAYLLYNAWMGDGSLDIQPGIGGRARTYDGGWEVFAMLNVFASFHRGLRDFTSLELNFPEPLGGGVAWRGAMVGGGR